MDLIIHAVVVLPFVPVIPIVINSEAGLLKKFALITESANRVSDTIICTTLFIFNLCSQTIATAPFSTAAVAYLCAWRFGKTIAPLVGLSLSRYVV